MKKAIFALIVSFMMVGTATAATVRQDCGCGLGGMALAQKEGLIWNLVGTFLNGISANQTFAMTSGTLDCGQPTKLAMLDKMNVFVAGNMDNLAIDIAQGQGESLDALAEIANIPVQKRPAFFAALQNNFDTIYPTTEITNDTVVKSIANIMDTI
ncbi:MAG: DUF3015 domain-containing protein [Deltaproteobacteria bacterium]|nr:DUF3015 domain-containing protein [Deltaproteobacteria bacterium]